MNAQLIDGKKIAAEVRAEVAESVREMKGRLGVTPGLAVVLVGGDPASAVYVRNKQRAAAEVGMDAQDVRLAAGTSQERLLEHVEELKANPRFHGILVQLPLPDHIDERTVLDALDPLKDVDGLHPENAGRLAGGARQIRARNPARHTADADAHGPRPRRQARGSLRAQ